MKKEFAIFFVITVLQFLLLSCGSDDSSSDKDGTETDSSNKPAMVFSLSGNSAEVGKKAESVNGALYGEQCFTSDAGGTYFSNEQAYSGDISLKTTVPEGSTGFGSLGGVVNFTKLENGRELVKGDEIWIRVRLYIPSDYQFNSGRSKFIRFRTGHEDEDGNKISDGYDDLYLDGSTPLDDPDYEPYWFIYEGAQRWYRMGKKIDWVGRDRWRTIELHLKFDDKTESEGGKSLVRVWVDGKLVGETKERRTLKHSYDTVYALYFFTYYGNETSPKEQSFYFDDLYFTTKKPDHSDEHGNPCIGI